MSEVCLVIMPFGSVRRPAIGVSLLKEELKDIGITVRVHYFNLKFAERIGLELNDKLAETNLDSPLIGELIFVKFAFEKHAWKGRQQIKEMLCQIFGSKHQHISNIDKITDEILYIQELVPEFLDDCTYNILRERPKLVGFSSTFEQNCPSLALARIIKETADIPIIFGGANCEGEMGAALLKCAPWVDFVCSGEGDIAFAKFAKSFLSGELCKINGIITRRSNFFDISLTNPIMNMDGLPFPNFDDYFAAFGHNQLRNEISPELVIETSRGCWWGEKFQCTFCGLNGSTMKYRSKSVQRVLDELRFLTNRYKIKKFQVVDNILDFKYVDRLFPALHDQALGIELFYETKANISKEQLILMMQGGVHTIQPGIESLSDNILRIMKKGVTALQNIQLLKWCREVNIIPNWNLIWGFPGESIEEYDRVTRIVPLLVHLHPPDGFGRINLDRFSPYFVEPSQNGITNVRPWLAYKFLYPLSHDDLNKIAYHFDFDYSDGRDPTLYTKELKKELVNWKNLWSNYRQTSPPLLNMIRKGDRIMIKDTRPSSVQSFHILADEVAKVYAICESMHSFNSILTKIHDDYPLIIDYELKDILSNLLDKNIMLQDKDKYLSLAIPIKN